MSKQDLLKGFIVSYTLPNDELKSVFIVAYSKEEAGMLFVKWAHGKNVYEQISGIVVQGARKTKRNKHMFTKEYYNKQNAFVKQLCSTTYGKGF